MHMLRLIKFASGRQGTVSLEYALLAAVVLSAAAIGSSGVAGHLSGTLTQMGAAIGGPGFSAKTLD